MYSPFLIGGEIICRYNLNIFTEVKRSSFRFTVFPKSCLQMKRLPEYLWKQRSYTVLCSTG